MSNASSPADANNQTATQTTSSSSDHPNPLTLEEVKAAIPEQGITMQDLVTIFKHRVVRKSCDTDFSWFWKLVKQAAVQDPVTKMLRLRGASDPANQSDQVRRLQTQVMSSSPDRRSLSTLEQIQAAVPEQGIVLFDLTRMLKPLSMAEFTILMFQAATLDPVTRIVRLRDSPEPLSPSDLERLNAVISRFDS